MFFSFFLCTSLRSVALNIWSFFAFDCSIRFYLNVFSSPQARSYTPRHSKADARPVYRAQWRYQRPQRDSTAIEKSHTIALIQNVVAFISSKSGVTLAPTACVHIRPYWERTSKLSRNKSLNDDEKRFASSLSWSRSPASLSMMLSLFPCLHALLSSSKHGRTKLIHRHAPIERVDLMKTAGKSYRNRKMRIF